MRTFPETSGIYRITCTTTGKFYIGSAINLRKRQKDHRHGLNQGTHGNPKLQNAWNKYGKEFFLFELLELVLIPEMLTTREQYWLDTLKPFGKNGFNIDRVAGSRLGSKRTPEAIEKSSAARRGKPSTRIGYTHSPETLEKMRNSHLGQKVSEETKQKLREFNLNKPPVSAEICEKIHLAKLGHTVSEKTRTKISVSKTGHTYTSEVYAGRMKTLIIIEPDGTEHLIHGVKKFCIEHGLDISSLMRVVKGQYSQHKGWTARLP